MHKKKQREPLRRAKKALQRKEDAKDGELKNNPEEIRKARAKPPAIGSRIVLREDADSANPTPGLSEVVRKKYGDKQLSFEEIKRQIPRYKAAPNGPELAYPGSVEM